MRERKGGGLIGSNYNSDLEETPRHPEAVGGAGPVQLLLAFLVIGALAWGVTSALGPSAAGGAASRAARGVKPGLLMFTADWCAPCQNFKAKVLRHSVVASRLDRSVHFEKVDLTKWTGEPAETARKYGVRAVPTLVLVDEDGREIDRYTGAHDPEWFLRWLDRHAP